jgi:hypothetical protein
MRFSNLVVLLVAALASACGSSASKNSDAAGEAGTVKPLDGGALSIDGKSSTDARDAARDTAAGRDGGTVDAPTAEALGLRDGGKDGVDGLAKLDAKRDVLAVDNNPDSPPPPQGTCASPYEIPTLAGSADLIIDNSYADHLLDMPCANNGRDVVIRFAVTDRELVYAHTFGATWNTALFLSQSCDTPQPPPGDDMVSCNDDACNTQQSQVSAVVNYGWHYLIVSGIDDASGEVGVHFERASIGNGPLSVLDSGTGTVQGKTSGQGGSAQCEASGPENSYWWAGCPDYAGGEFRASTCGGATFDTVLALQIPRTQAIACNDDFDTCGMQSTLSATIPPGAGLNIVTVDSSTTSNFGNYTLSYTRP